VLVNNAGIPKRRNVRALDAATVDTVMQVNFLGPTRLTLALLPQMIERGAGHIVNLSSVAATLSSPGEAAYDASKSALAVFSEAMAIDLWDSGIKVLVVYPGVVDTPLFQMPDNDPFTAPVEFITVGELVDATFDALDRGAIEVYIPEYFKEFATGKANNVEGFVAGTAEYMRQQTAGG
jgi:short-subunit dehydrogenase